MTGTALSAAALSSLLFAGSLAADIGPTNVEIRTAGSTTVGPLTNLGGPAFELLPENGGVDYHIPGEWQGSSSGWYGINNPDDTLPSAPDGTPPDQFAYYASVAQSSRVPNASNEEGGTSHVFQIGNDALIFCAKDEAATAHLAGGITTTEIQTMFEIGGVTAFRGAADGDGTQNANLARWIDVNPAWPDVVFATRARTQNSGTQPDMLGLTGTDGALEELTQIDLAGFPGTANPDPGNPNTDPAEGYRNQESVDSLTTCANNSNEVAYTGFGPVASFPALAAQVIQIPVKDDVHGQTVFVPPTVENVQNGDFAYARTVFYMTRRVTDNLANLQFRSASVSEPYMVSSWGGGVNKFINNADIATEVELTKAMDYINYMHSSAGDALVLQELAPLAAYQVFSYPPFPNPDIDLNGNIGLGDVSPIALNWDEDILIKGGIRADIDNNGNIGLGDVSAIANNWDTDETDPGACGDGDAKIEGVVFCANGSGEITPWDGLAP